MYSKGGGETYIVDMNMEGRVRERKDLGVDGGRLFLSFYLS